MQPPNYCIQNPSEQQQEKNKAKKKLQHRCGDKASGSGCDGHANPRTKPQPEN